MLLLFRQFQHVGASYPPPMPAPVRRRASASVTASTLRVSSWTGCEASGGAQAIAATAIRAAVRGIATGGAAIAAGIMSTHSRAHARATVDALAAVVPMSPIARTQAAARGVTSILYWITRRSPDDS